MEIFTVLKIGQEGSINEIKAHTTLESANRHALSICEEIHGEVFGSIEELNEYQDMLLEGGFDPSLIRVLETEISLDARALLSAIEALAIEQGIVELQGLTSLSLHVKTDAITKDKLNAFNGVDEGENTCYVNIEDFDDEENYTGLKSLADEAGKFGFSRIEVF